MLLPRHIIVYGHLAPGEGLYNKLDFSTGMGDKATVTVASKGIKQRVHAVKVLYVLVQESVLQL